MTPVEKRTLQISLAALAVSIISPIATYFLLDPTMKQFALRGKLLVKPTYQATYMRDIKPDGATDSALVLSILNTGKLPAKDVSIVARFPAGSSHFVAPTTAPDLLIDLDSHSTPAVA